LLYHSLSDFGNTVVKELDFNSKRSLLWVVKKTAKTADFSWQVILRDCAFRSLLAPTPIDSVQRYGTSRSLWNLHGVTRASERAPAASAGMWEFGLRVVTHRSNAGVLT
jgi:hypothetical protein